jgi:hypothetical protein
MSVSPILQVGQNRLSFRFYVRLTTETVKKPVLYVIPIENILGKLSVVPLGDTGTIPHHLSNVFPGAPGDSRPGAGNGSQVWFVNFWAFGRSSVLE